MVFYAEGIDTAKTTTDEPIVFSEVKVHEGGCYDDTTGVFTTTVPGTYVFTTTVESVKENSDVFAWITGTTLSTPHSAVPTRPQAAAVCRYSWGWDRRCG